MLQRTDRPQLPDRATKDLCLKISAFGRDHGIPQPKIDPVLQTVRTWAEEGNLPSREITPSLGEIESPKIPIGRATVLFKNEQNFLQNNGYSAKQAELYLNEIENLLRGIIQSGRIDPAEFSLSDPEVSALIKITVKENVIAIAKLKGANADDGVNLIQVNSEKPEKLSLTTKALRMFAGEKDFGTV